MIFGSVLPVPKTNREIGIGGAHSSFSHQRIAAYVFRRFFGNYMQILTDIGSFGKILAELLKKCRVQDIGTARLCLPGFCL